MTIDLSKVAAKKSEKTQLRIREAARILEAAQIKVADLTPRRLEKMALSFLALGEMTPTKNWADCGDIDSSPNLTSRQIISYINDNFEENISSGSYDDIRRKDLLRPVGMGLIIKSANKPWADTNDGTRGYGISNEFAELARSFGSKSWGKKLSSFEVDDEYLAVMEGSRQAAKHQVIVADGLVIELDGGPHNQIQKDIVEEFLPRFGYGAKLLYIGDASEKQLLKYTEEMKSLKLNIADRGMLPDIVAFSELKGWLFLIEAVHSSNPLNPERCIELRRTVLKDCEYPVVFVTAFLTKADFRKWVSDIAWETEVWICDAPGHMIHFNGDKFLGPHVK